MLAVGGWTDSGHSKYSELLASRDKITRFVNHSAVFLQQYGFDGLDLDYEYPGYDRGQGASDTDKAGFTQLVRQLSQVYRDQGLELTAAVSASKTVIDSGYDVGEVCQHLDAVHLMSYDLHGQWEQVTNHHSPLTGDHNDTLTTDFG